MWSAWTAGRVPVNSGAEASAVEADLDVREVPWRHLEELPASWLLCVRGRDHLLVAQAARDVHGVGFELVDDAAGAPPGHGGAGVERALVLGATAGLVDGLEA